MMFLTEITLFIQISGVVFTLSIGKLPIETDVCQKGEREMPLVSMTDMLRKALEGKYAIGHFNINNLEFAQAILLAAEEEKAPVVLAVSPGYIPHIGGLRVAAAMVRELIKEYNITVPVALHLDHGSSYEQCLQAMDAGFTSVMIDASHHPLEMNIAETKKVVEAARVFGVSVEAEVGRIGGQEDDMIVDEAEAMYAVPEECERFVKWRSLTLAFFCSAVFTLVTPIVEGRALLCIIQACNGFSLGLLFSITIRNVY
jgi:hypothetical protein